MSETAKIRLGSAPTRVPVQGAIPLDLFSREDPLDEQSFIRTLCLERKRTERSGNRFVLMLLEAGGLLKEGSRVQALDRVLRALQHSTRSTDVTGWYKQSATIGVIFTEIGESEGNEVVNALLARVTTALSRNLSIDQINAIKLSFHVFPDPSGKNGPDSPDDPIYPDLLPEVDPKRLSRVVKRGIDIAGSLCGLVLLSPPLLLMAALIKLTSKGPVLFRQERLGQYGRTFQFLKFRSMYTASDNTIHREYTARFISGQADTGVESGERQIYKIVNDPRVTAIGRFLRRTSLDELPQLINVLRGEMSLVGPRPPIVYEFDCYQFWHKRRLLTVKPGITGLWQVGGRSRVRFDEMVRLDLQYATSWSVWLDLKILLLTPRAVLAGSGAY